MTLYQFKILEMPGQAQAAWELGEHIATRTTGEHKILLWIVEDFYVEIFYSYNENEIEKIVSFCNPGLIEGYLDQIDISDIYK